jgi:hypothetical protein
VECSFAGKIRGSNPCPPNLLFAFVTSCKVLFGFQGSHFALATWGQSRLSSHCFRELPTLS